MNAGFIISNTCKTRETGHPSSDLERRESPRCVSSDTPPRTVRFPEPVIGVERS